MSITSIHIPNELNIQHSNYSQHNTMSRKRNHDDEDYTDSKRRKKPGRKQMKEEDEEEIDEDDSKAKKKVQNRAAQRAFRERKERYVKELEKKIKYLQESHVNATTKLHDENRQLRAVVSLLESGVITLDLPTKKESSQSWLDSFPTPKPLSVINTFPSNPLPPLQIRPIIPNTGKKPLKIQKTEVSKPKVPVNSNKQQQQQQQQQQQHFVFSITTPASLRINNENDQFPTVDAVQLYPNHCHPANNTLLKSNPEFMPLSPLLNNTLFDTTSSNSSIITASEDEEQEGLDFQFLHEDNLLTFYDDDTFKPFLDIL